MQAGLVVMYNDIRMKDGANILLILHGVVKVTIASVCGHLCKCVVH